MEAQKKKKVCEFCGAEFDEMLPKCPYCDSTNIKGAETAYMEMLEDVRSDMEELTQMPAREAKKEWKKQTKFILLVIGIMLVMLLGLVGLELLSNSGFDKSQQEKQEDYLWKQEKLSAFEEAYEQGNDEALMDMYYEAVVENKPVYDWEHVDYCYVLSYYKDMEYVWAKIDRGEPPMSVSEYAGLLTGYSFVEYYYNKLSEDEKERFTPYYEKAKADYEARWEFQGEEWETLEKEREENYGIIPYETAEEYVEAWLERQEK